MWLIQNKGTKRYRHRRANSRVQYTDIIRLAKFYRTKAEAVAESVDGEQVIYHQLRPKQDLQLTASRLTFRS